MIHIEEETVSVAEAARELEMHPTTIVRAIHDGRLRTVTPKSNLAKRVPAYRIPRSEIERIKQK